MLVIARRLAPKRFAPAAQALRRASLLPSAHYLALVADGKITRDEHQLTALAALDRVYAAVEGYAPPAPAPAQPSGGLGGALGAFARRVGLADAPAAKQARGYDSKAPRGAYVHGGVGAGKTFTMDMFFDLAPTASKQRVHFHAFMLSVHRRLHDLQGDDRIKLVADDVLREGALVCFDEFQVTDVADALILSQLFGTMWARGVVTVATSNRPPGDLYEGGINRGYFLPFIDLLRRHCVVHEVGSSTDYRRLLSDGMDEFLFVARDGENQDDANAKCDDFFSQLLDGAEPRSLDLNVAFNRTLHVRQAHPDGTIGRFDFDELCSVELGSSDYRALAGQFRAVLVEGIPVLTLEEHDKARRFITLIDELYEADCALACSAVAPPDHLFRGRSGETTRDEESKHETGGIEVKVGEMFGIDVAQSSGKTVGDLASVRELAFAFERASSRMTEMCSKSWWQKAQP